MEQLFKHQVEGVEFLKKRVSAILADDMGLGKTRTSIVATATMPGGKIVICPASIKINWKREIEAVCLDAKIFILESGKKVEIPTDIEWLIINYDLVGKYQEELQQLADTTMPNLIIDEAHYIKSKKAIRSKNTLEITSKANRVFCLTGTPVLNRPIELFNLLKATGHYLGKNASKYSARYCNGHLEVIFKRNGNVIRYWDESGSSNTSELKELTKDHVLRRKKEDVMDLPAKIISVQPCELSKEWKKEYTMAWDKYLEWVETNPEGKDIDNIIDAKHLVEINKLKQVCSHSKVKRIVEDILNTIEQGQKVVVFSQYTKVIEEILSELRDKKVGCVRLTGQDDMDTRQNAVDQFQNNDNCKVFVANMKAAGVGITLTKASVVIFADMDWSPEIHRQAEDRAHRIGTTGTVNVYYYIAELTIEEDIITILENKRRMIDELMEGTDATSSVGKEFLKLLSKRTKSARI